MKQNLAIVTTHPIQYNAPWFRLLNQENDIEIKVFYTWSQAQYSVKDRAFGKEIKWDIPLLDGYPYTFVENISKNPGSHHKMGIICPELISTINQYNPSVILVFGWYLKSHLDAIKHYRNKIPVWFRGDSTLLDYRSRMKSLLRKLYLTHIYSNIDKALYVGENNKNYFLEFGVKKENLIFANHAIDNDRFFDIDGYYQKQADEWRNSLGIKTSDTVILYAGKFQAVKQPVFLMECFLNVMLNKKRNLKLIMLGNGTEESKLRNLAREYKDIIFLPFQNQSLMPIVYRLGDIYCLPSKSETWGLAINEAMASSRPVIVSDKVGCAVDLVCERNGFVFNSTEKNQLIEIFKNLDNFDLRKMGFKSKEIIGDWNFKNIVNAIRNNLSF